MIRSRCDWTVCGLSASPSADYEPSAVERLRFISDAQDSGLTLAEIASILELRAQGEATCHRSIESLERRLDDLVSSPKRDDMDSLALGSRPDPDMRDHRLWGISSCSDTLSSELLDHTGRPWTATKERCTGRRCSR